MGFKFAKKDIFLICLITLYFINSNSIAETQLVPMQKIGEDATGDGTLLNLDIVSVYAASFDGMLMISVVYTSTGDFGLYSNITIQNSNLDLFLIQASIGQLGTFVAIAHATSLEEDSLNADEIQLYEEPWRVKSQDTEITIFIDWIDIGGETPIDLVFWTGRPFDNPDRLPDSGHLSFNGVLTIDTTGYFGDPPSTTSNDDETTKKMSDEISEDQTVEFVYPLSPTTTYLGMFAFIGLSTYAIRYYWISQKITDLFNENISNILSPLLKNNSSLILLLQSRSDDSDSDYEKEIQEAIPVEIFQFKFLLHPIRLSLSKLLYDRGTLSLSEAKELMQIPSKVINKHLQVLESKGYIETELTFVNESPTKIIHLSQLGSEKYRMLSDLLVEFVSK